MAHHLPKHRLLAADREGRRRVHETAITESVVDAVTERMPGARITCVRLEIGALSGVVADSVRFCFDLVTEGTTWKAPAWRSPSSQPGAGAAPAAGSSSPTGRFRCARAAAPTRPSCRAATCGSSRSRRYGARLSHRHLAPGPSPWAIAPGRFSPGRQTGPLAGSLDPGRPAGLRRQRRCL